MNDFYDFILNILLNSIPECECMPNLKSLAACKLYRYQRGIFVFSVCRAPLPLKNASQRFQKRQSEY
jgi:hypothetical protein